MEFLKEQIKKMRQIVFVPKIMEIPEIDGRRSPAIISRNRILENGLYKSIPLFEYFVLSAQIAAKFKVQPEKLAGV